MVADASRAPPFWFLSELSFENLDPSDVAGTNRLLGGDIQDECGTAGGSKLDEKNLGDFKRPTRHATHHPLTQPGIETTLQQHEIGDTGWLKGDDRGNRRGGRRRNPKPRGQQNKRGQPRTTSGA